MPRIAALLSGGVDSASALCRYIQLHPKLRKYICAYYLKIWLEDELSFLGDCPWREDIFYAEKTAQELDVPFKIISLQKEYHEKIISYTLEELKRGGTPSPDVFCNERIKFGSFLEHVSADIVISGHYAQIRKKNETAQLYMAPDPIKDQTYFLSHVHQQQLVHIEFPIGALTKQEVRKFACKNALPPQNRKDSQGVCFLGKIKYRDFVKHHLGELSGPIVDVCSKKILGTHSGAWFYTIGQRTGLGLSDGPWYVSDKSIHENTVWVRHASRTLPHTLLKGESVHWIRKMFTAESTRTTKNMQVKLRHGAQLYDAHVDYKTHDNTAYVYLFRGDTGIAPGQIVVFYENRECLGCARISKTMNPETFT